MKYIIFLLTILTLFNGCSKPSFKQIKIKECNVEGELKSIVHKVPPILLSPFAICVTNDKLIVLESKTDTLFNIFNINTLEHLYNDGVRGGGPNEFMTIAPHYFSPTTDGFKILFAETNDINEYKITETNIVLKEKHKLKIERTGINGLIYLNDETYVMHGDFNSDNEFEILDNTNGKTEKKGIYPDDNKITFKNNMERYTIYLKNGVSHPNGSHFASFYLNFKRCRFYDNKGNIIKDVTLEIDPYKSTLFNEINNRIVYYYAPPVANEKYIYVLCANKNRNDYFKKMPELQIWDWNGNLISIHQCDKNISMIALDKKRNKIYALDYYTEDEIYEYDLSEIQETQK